VREKKVWKAFSTFWDAISARWISGADD